MTNNTTQIQSKIQITGLLTRTILAILIYFIIL
jgi:hypothetical protein